MTVLRNPGRRMQIPDRNGPKPGLGYGAGGRPGAGFQIPGKDVKNLNYGGGVPPGKLSPGQRPKPPAPAMNTGAQNQAPGSDARFARLQDQWRAGDNQAKIRQMMMNQTNYNDGTPADAEVATWLRRQQMNPAQQDQQRIRALTQGLGGKMADPMSRYNLNGGQFGERGQGLVNELGGLLQERPGYQFDWNTRVPPGGGANVSRAQMNQDMGIGSPSEIWNQLGFGSSGSNMPNSQPSKSANQELRRQGITADPSTWLPGQSAFLPGSYRQPGPGDTPDSNGLYSWQPGYTSSEGGGDGLPSFDPDGSPVGPGLSGLLPPNPGYDSVLPPRQSPFGGSTPGLPGKPQSPFPGGGWRNQVGRRPRRRGKPRY